MSYNVPMSFSNGSTGSTGGSGIYAPATITPPSAPAPSTPATTSAACPYHNKFVDGSYTKTIVDALQRDPYWIPPQDAEPGLKAAFALIESAIPHFQRGDFSQVGALPEVSSDTAPLENASSPKIDDQGSTNGPTGRALQKALRWNLPSEGVTLASL
jgi:hypothetical protein